jgi:cardiolipin synthase
MASGPDENHNVIHKLFIGSIASARQRVLLTAPYFVPDESLYVALSTAALSGVDVRVLVPAKNDLRLVGAASRSYYPELVNAGVRIFEYGPPMLHAKTLVVDDFLSVVGTANADARSFRLNFEVILACYDRPTCEELAAAFERDLGSTREVTSEVIDGYRFPQRLFQNFARVLSPTL